VSDKLKYQPLLKTGEYVAEIASAKLVTGLYGQQVEFTFELTGAFVGREVVAWASAKFSPGTKLYRWWGAATSGTIKAGTDFDTDDVVGKTVVLVILQETNKQGLVVNTVKDILVAEESDVVEKV